MEKATTTCMRLAAAVMAVCLAVVMAVGTSALQAPTEAFAATNQKVLDQRSGVFKFNWGIHGQEYARGSAFLINEDTIVTAYHCVMPSTTELDYFGLSPEDVMNESTYTVTISGDFQVPATLEKYSEKQDMAILKLDQPLNNVTSLTLRDSSEVDASEVVYSLGFPVAADQNAVITFTSNDVAVIDGTVTKPEGQMTYKDNTLAERSGSFIMSSCRLEGGSSGGPMVDEDGYVVGICVSGDSSYYYAAAGDVLMEALDTMGYSYKKPNPTPTPDPNTNPVSSSSSANSSDFALNLDGLKSAIKAAEDLGDSSKYTSDSYAAVTSALDAAKAALNTELSDPADEAAYKEAQGKIDSAAEALNAAVKNVKPADEGPNMMLIIAIIAAVVVVIAIIVILLVVRSRKKKKQAEAPTTPLAGATPMAGVAPVSPVTPVQPTLQQAQGGSQSWQKPGQAAYGAGAPDTTILNDDAPDTVILFQAASGGSLTRMSTNEQIPINSAEFTIGRERSKVNYCLEGNSSISRVHVRIVVRDGKVYCVDNKAANGTYVNGVKSRPGEEVLLKSGDIITLADEKFKYNA